MKKIFKITALALVCIIALSAMTSCGRMYEGVQKKAEKAGFVCYPFEYGEMAPLNRAVRSFGINAELKSACYITNDIGEYAYLYEFDKISAASSFAENFWAITGICDGDLIIKRDNKVVIAAKESAIDKIW